MASRFGSLEAVGLKADPRRRPVLVIHECFLFDPRRNQITCFSPKKAACSTNRDLAYEELGVLIADHAFGHRARVYALAHQSITRSSPGFSCRSSFWDTTGSEPERSRRRCASHESRWRRPAWSATPCRAGDESAAEKHRSYSQVALVPSSKVIHKLPRSPWMNWRTVVALCCNI